jgi:flagellar basal-body rod modification protein FlgD
MDATTSVSSVTTATSSQKAKVKTTRDLTTPDKENFLKLLVAQLQYQDPMNPTTDREYIGQLAQFRALEVMQTLSDTMTAMLDMQQLGQGAALIGKTVEASQTGSEELIKGEVTEVGIENGVAILKVGAHVVPLHNVVRVANP